MISQLKTQKKTPNQIDDEIAKEVAHLKLTK
jgi:hypothetical protein